MAAVSLKNICKIYDGGVKAVDNVNIEIEDKEFVGGKVIHKKEINRIQFLFDEKPNEDVRNNLKHNGFHWSRNEGAWQREFNERTIKVTNDFMVARASI